MCCLKKFSLSATVSSVSDTCFALCASQGVYTPIDCQWRPADKLPECWLKLVSAPPASSVASPSASPASSPVSHPAPSPVSQPAPSPVGSPVGSPASSPRSESPDVNCGAEGSFEASSAHPAPARVSVLRHDAPVRSLFDFLDGRTEGRTDGHTEGRTEGRDRGGAAEARGPTQGQAYVSQFGYFRGLAGPAGSMELIRP